MPLLTEQAGQLLGDNSDNLIEIQNLKYSRGPRAIFDGLDLTIRRGEVTAIMGPSGTGKTTLLRLITRQLIPERGAIYIDGVDIATLSQAELYQLRQRFGMLFQNGALLTDMSVFENVAFPLREHTNLSNRLIRHVVLTKLHAVGLRGAADLMPRQLSGGMARRVALARAMAMDPDTPQTAPPVPSTAPKRAVWAMPMSRSGVTSPASFSKPSTPNSSSRRLRPQIDARREPSPTGTASWWTAGGSPSTGTVCPFRSTGVCS